VFFRQRRGVRLRERRAQPRDRGRGDRLGRIIEVLRGKPWDQVLRERLIAPLGLTAGQAALLAALIDHLLARGLATGGTDDA
ncbi:MAG: hypothetical protein ACRDOI_23420, partial [Trebonia sp.]